MKPKKQRYRLTKLTLNELSAVDHPAQEGAQIMLAKRADDGVTTTAASLLLNKSPGDRPDRAVAKAGVLTTSELGHQHLIDDTNQNGSTSWEYSGALDSSGYRTGHSHPWVKGEDGTITIGDAEGHGHQLLGAEAPKDDTMKTDADKIAELNASLEASKALVAAAQAEALKFQRIAALPAEVREHFDRLSGVEAEAFLGKSVTDQLAAIEVAKAADPVLHTTRDGIEVRKSHGALMLAMAKKNDQLAAENEATAEKNATLELTKRADTDLEFLPGETSVKIELLRAVDGIKDEPARKAAHAILAAHNGSMAKAFVHVGSQRTVVKGAVVAGDPESVLEGIAKGLQAESEKAGKSLSYLEAYDAALLTPQGSKAYGEMAAAKRMTSVVAS